MQLLPPLHFSINSPQYYLGTILFYLKLPNSTLQELSNLHYFRLLYAHIEKHTFLSIQTKLEVFFDMFYTCLQCITLNRIESALNIPKYPSQIDLSLERLCNE